MALVGNISGSVQSNSKIGLSGTIIIANQPDSAFPSMPGTNVAFFVSGSANTDLDVSVFGGDLTVSGSFIGYGNLMEISGTLAVTEGISGSLTTLADGTSYLVEGTNITITSQSNGSIVISSTAGGGGGGDDFFDSTVVGSIFTTGSTAFIDQEAITSPADKGTDVFFYVSGSMESKDGATPGVALFGGDIVVSGSMFAAGNVLEMSGTLSVTEGISGSLTQLTDGTSYLVAGNNISIVSQSNGSVLISSTFSQVDDYFDSTTANSIYTTGSAAFIGQEPSIDSPADKGTDVFFYVSGSQGSKDGPVPGVALFGGDVTVSGSLTLPGNFLQVTGTLEVTNGISGSLTQLTDGTSYLVAGNNTEIISQSNGSVLINSVPTGTGNEIQYNNGGIFGGSSNFEFDGSTVYLTGSLELGSNSKVNAQYAMAQGLNSNANASYSIALGRAVTSNGSWAFAQGDGTIANGTTSHAEGRQTKTYAQSSHAEGELTETDVAAAYSHAEGYYTIASASHQHVEGKFNLRDNNHSLLVVGNGTGDDNSLRSDIVRVEIDSVQFSGSLFQRNSGSSTVGFMGDDVAAVPTDKGTDVFFYVSGSQGSKDGSASGAALFGGDVVISGTLHGGSPLKVGSNLGVTGSLEVTNGISGSLTHLTDGTSYLVAGNNISIVSQSNGSITISNTFADDYFDSTTAGSIFTSGSAAFVGPGEWSTIDSPSDKGTDVFFYVSGSTAASRTNVALFGGHVIISGSMTQGNFAASGGTTAQFARAHGERTSATGTAAHAEGRFAVAQGPYSHAEGDSTYTTGNGSHAEGLDSATYANYSHAEGRSTEARANYSHVEGYDAITRAEYSHAEGRDTETISTALYSHAEGSGSITVGVASHAGGLCTIASGSNQTVFGQYNLRNNPDSLFVIGNGTSDNNSDRSDVIRVQPGTLGSGQLQVSGSMSVSGSYSGNTNTLSGPGTIGSAGHSMLLTSTGASQAITLADGTWPGQLKYVVADSGYSGATPGSVITPTNALGYTSVTFDTAGQAVTFFWTGSKWVIVGSYGAIITP